MGYEELPSFEHAYLEDSWVTDVVVGPGVVEIALDVVLTETHRELAPRHRRGAGGGIRLATDELDLGRRRIFGAGPARGRRSTR